MAFPVARSARAGVQTSNATSWTLTYPGAGDILDGGGSAIVAGDLILINIGRDGSSGTGSITDFTPLFDQTDGSARGLTFAKVAAGTESGTFSYSPGASEQGAWRITVYKTWHGTISGGVEALGGATGSSANPDPASASPSWGSADNLWRAVCAHDSGLVTMTAYPTNYTLNQDGDQSGGGNGAGIGGASRQLATGTENPGAFTMSASDGWVAWVVVIRGGSEAFSGAATPVTHTHATSATGRKGGTGAATNVQHTHTTSATGGKTLTGAATNVSHASATSATGAKNGQGTASESNTHATSATGTTGRSGVASVAHATDATATGATGRAGTASVSHTTAEATTGAKQGAGAATDSAQGSTTFPHRKSESR